MKRYDLVLLLVLLCFFSSPPSAFAQSYDEMYSETHNMENRHERDLTQKIEEINANYTTAINALIEAATGNMEQCKNRENMNGSRIKTFENITNALELTNTAFKKSFNTLKAMGDMGKELYANSQDACRGDLSPAQYVSCAEDVTYIHVAALELEKAQDALDISVKFGSSLSDLNSRIMDAQASHVLVCQSQSKKVQKATVLITGYTEKYIDTLSKIMDSHVATENEAH